MKVFKLRMSKTMYQSLATVIAPFILILIGFLYRMYEENMLLWMKNRSGLIRYNNFRLFVFGMYN